MNTPPYGKGARAVSEFILAEMANAVESKDWFAQEFLINETCDILDREVKADTLNRLLVMPGHEHHQAVTWEIQQLGSPSSIPYIRQILDSKFETLQYTCSDQDVIAKWFSHALASINTPESIELIRVHAKSDDPGIAEEMRYRLMQLGLHS